MIYPLFILYTERPAEVQPSNMTHVLFTPQTPLPLKKSLAQMTVRIASITTLGKRPVAVNNLNGESFQQDPLVAYNGKFYS